MSAEKQQSAAEESEISECCNLTLSDIEQLVSDNHSCRYYELQYGASIYHAILHKLTNERFDGEDAQQLWSEILFHHGQLSGLLQRDPGILVSTLDYLRNKREMLKKPVIIAEDNNHIASASTRDALTSLYSKQVFEVILDKEMHEHHRHHESFSVAIVDIDNFAYVNENFGRQVGDRTLGQVGELINHHIREMDIASRYGGEEFALLFPHSRLYAIYEVAERIRSAVQQQQFVAPNLTVSIGVAESGPEKETPEALLARADKALIQAKEQGKNQTVKADIC